MEKQLREAGVKTMQNTNPAYDSRSAGHAESGIKFVKEKVRKLMCFARDLHGVTIGKSHVSLAWCVRLAAQIICRSHRRTYGMTGYRRAYGRSRMPRRYVPWSEKVFHFEHSKKKVQVEAKWHDGIFLGIKDESEFAVVVSHTEDSGDVCCSAAPKESRGNYNLELREMSRTECSWMSGLQSQRDKLHRRQSVKNDLHAMAFFCGPWHLALRRGLGSPSGENRV